MDIFARTAFSSLNSEIAVLGLASLCAAVAPSSRSPSPDKLQFRLFGSVAPPSVLRLELFRRLVGRCPHSFGHRKFGLVAPRPASESLQA
ncbi:hypothetical protein SAY86_000751 [Trapa natans]|uniref:Uncharacterized protein n=1 Tax=Trapa natans TaxID=22666 RepID=A0AAN7RN78_TRANT|nr:hypothetical protein SAY86_000751 [Trapa natans]